jgi:hypothetical protein
MLKEVKNIFNFELINYKLYNYYLSLPPLKEIQGNITYGRLLRFKIDISGNNWFNNCNKWANIQVFRRLV